MDDRRIQVLYDEYVVAPDLERVALLRGLRERCARDATVLYPGSSIHVTPSFFFQHVVYVDRSELARVFFGRAAGVLEVVRARKTYAQAPYVRFIEQDFTLPLPIPDESCDVLLALYAGAISATCARYVRPGGLLLSNDHHGDAADAARLADFTLEAVVEERRADVRFHDDALERWSPPGPPRRHAPKPAYYLFRRARVTRRAAT